MAQGFRQRFHHLVGHRPFHFLVFGAAHRKHHQRLGQTGLFVQGALYLFLYQAKQAVRQRPLENRFNHRRRGDNLAGHQFTVTGRHLFAPFQEQALPFEQPQVAHRLLGIEDHLQCQPVGEPAGEQPKQRNHPDIMGQGPDHGLNNTDGKPKPDTGIADKLELHMTGFQEHPVEQFLVPHQGIDDQILEVEHPVNIAFDILHDLLDHVRGFFLDALNHQPFHRFRSRLPQARLVLRRNLTGDVVHRANQRIANFFRHPMRVELVENILRLEQPFHHQVTGDAGHGGRLARNNALPAQKRADTHKAERLEHHLDGHHLGAITNRRGHEGHGQIQQPVGLDVCENQVDIGNHALLLIA